MSTESGVQGTNKSAWWRRMVTRSAHDKRYAWTVALGMCGACYAAGQVLMYFTTSVAVDVEALEKDELRTYDGQRALALGQNMIATVLKEAQGKEQIEEGYSEVMVPKTQWHPSLQDEEDKHWAGKKYNR